MKAYERNMDRKVGRHRRYQPVVPMRQAGLDAVAACCVEFIGCIATLAYKALGSRRGDIDRRSMVNFDGSLFPRDRSCDRAPGSVVGKNIYAVARK